MPFTVFIVRTDVKGAFMNVLFRAVFDGYHLGLGVYCYSLLNIGIGYFSILNKFKKII